MATGAIFEAGGTSILQAGFASDGGLDTGDRPAFKARAFLLEAGGEAAGDVASAVYRVAPGSTLDGTVKIGEKVSAL